MFFLSQLLRIWSKKLLLGRHASTCFLISFGDSFKVNMMHIQKPNECADGACMVYHIALKRALSRPVQHLGRTSPNTQKCDQMWGERTSISRVTKNSWVNIHANLSFIKNCGEVVKIEFAEKKKPQMAIFASLIVFFFLLPVSKAQGE